MSSCFVLFLFFVFLNILLSDGVVFHVILFFKNISLSVNVVWFGEVGLIFMAYQPLYII